MYVVEINEPRRRGGLLKILSFVFNAMLLIGVGLGVGFLLLVSLAIILLARSWSMIAWAVRNMWQNLAPLIGRMKPPLKSVLNNQKI